MSAVPLVKKCGVWSVCLCMFVCVEYFCEQSKILSICSVVYLKLGIRNNEWSLL